MAKGARGTEGVADQTADKDGKGNALFALGAPPEATAEVIEELGREKAKKKA
ncbi:hypothetical protein [Verrucomicrobium sp. BvORR106]|uniref:hypothetical protein n=1 Tax=Verrucomicrobium sp. BvORR106 TaxID=1403819 RepID=UPI000AB70CF1|nr:hypothetical protein [Verrucomicrobium sp. BvORR106]